MIVRSNSIVNSTRVIKIASSLNKRYYVRVIGWNRANLPVIDFQQFVADLDIRTEGPNWEIALSNIYAALLVLYFRETDQV